MKVSRMAAELKAKGVRVVDFGAGEPDFDSPSVAVEKARLSLAEGFTKYTPAAGLTDLRHTLLERYRRDFGTPWRELEEVVITVGAKAALFELALALYDHGDEVIIPSPSWVTFAEQVRFCGALPVPVETSADDGFRIHADAVLGALSGATRAILLNSPCNPTGGMLAGDDLRRIVEVAADRDLVVIADETYERFVYDQSSFPSCAALAAEFPNTVILVGSFSKTYAMTGWRVGYLLGPREVLGSVAEIQSHATSNPTSFAMTGALAALNGAEDDVAAMIEEFRCRRDLVVAGLNRLSGVSCKPPSGAFYAFPRVSDCYANGQGSLEFASFLLDEAGVAVVPGVAFGADDHIRISFACSREDLDEGLGRIERALA